MEACGWISVGHLESVGSSVFIAVFHSRPTGIVSGLIFSDARLGLARFLRERKAGDELLTMA